MHGIAAKGISDPLTFQAASYIGGLTHMVSYPKFILMAVGGECR